MYAIIGLIQKPDDVSVEDFRMWWLEKHVPHARQLPGLRRYITLPLGAQFDGQIRDWTTDPDYHGVALMWFDDEESARAAVASPQGHSDLDHYFRMVRQSFIFAGESLTQLDTLSG